MRPKRSRPGKNSNFDQSLSSIGSGADFQLSGGQPTGVTGNSYNNNFQLSGGTPVGGGGTGYETDYDYDYQHTGGQQTRAGYDNNNKFHLSGARGTPFGGYGTDFQLSTSIPSETSATTGNEHKEAAVKRSGFGFSGHRGRGGALRLSLSKGMNRLPPKNEVQNTWPPTPYDEEGNKDKDRPTPKAEVGMMGAINTSQLKTFGKRIQLRENGNGHGQAHSAYGNSNQNNNAAQGKEKVAPVNCNNQDHTGSMVAMAKVFRDFAACINNFADNLEQNYHH